MSEFVNTYRDRNSKTDERSSDSTAQARANIVGVLQKFKVSPSVLTHGEVAQLQKSIGNRAIVQLMKDAAIQRVESEEEEEDVIQGKFDTVQRVNADSEDEPVQMKAENNTGLPDNLKSGVENLSGMDISDVRVHYNSSSPSEVGALAYTQGTDIHVAPGQERHLPHEAWHVVQQAQGRVNPTMQMKDVAINDDESLEHEADQMGEMASQMKI